VAGFITTPTDVPLGSPPEITRALRLDYEKTGSGAGPEDVHGVRTRTEHRAGDEVMVPGSARLVEAAATGRPRRAEPDAAPFSGSDAGYSAGSPEPPAHPGHPSGGIRPRHGAQMWRIGRDGSESLHAVYRGGRWRRPG
jgi:hypothetical protein